MKTFFLGGGGGMEGRNGRRVDRWEALNWSCDLRANGSSKKNAWGMDIRQTDRQINRQTCWLFDWLWVKSLKCVFIILYKVVLVTSCKGLWPCPGSTLSDVHILGRLLCTALYCTMQYSTRQCSTLQISAVLCSVMYCTALHWSQNQSQSHN